jgi:hypothetical protein
MDKQLKDLKAGFETIYDKETSNRIKKDVFNRLEEKKTHTFSVKKRATYLSSAAIIVIGLLLGSGFVSPTMADVLSQIPYFDFKGKEGKEKAVLIEEYTRSVTEIKREELGLESIPYVIIGRDKKHKTLYKKSYE